MRKIRSVMIALTVLALVAGSALAQEGESDRGECNCERDTWARVLTLPRGEWTFSGRRAQMGVFVDSWQDEEDDERGARIDGLVEDGPAEEAGLEEGDVITALNGHGLLEPLDDRRAENRLDLDGSVPVQRLLALTRELEPGDEVEVEYLRDGDARSATLVAEEVDARNLFLEAMSGLDLRDGPRVLVGPGRRGEFRFRDGGPRTFFFDRRPEIGQRRLHFEEDGPGVRILGGSAMVGRCPDSSSGWTLVTSGCVAGLSLVPLNRRLGEYFEAERGVLVTDAEEDSSLGLEAGDVILAIDGRRVDSPEDVIRVLSSYRDGEELEVRIVRQGRETTVRGEMD